MLHPSAFRRSLEFAPLLPAHLHPVSMDIVVNEELRAYIDPLTPEEYESLERSILEIGRAHV